MDLPEIVRFISLLLFSIASLFLAFPGLVQLVNVVRVVVRRPALSLYSPTGRAGGFVFLVPAHNEAGSIVACVESLIATGAPLVVVVADNCTDDTALYASEAGARVLIRHDPARPGKPHAIAWALDHLRYDDFEALVIIDADSTVQPDFLEALTHQGRLDDVLGQAYFDVANSGDGPLTRMAKVLATVRYEIEFPIKSRLGLNCPLTGNGMVLGSQVIRQHGWREFSLTENWELYARLTALSVPVRFIPAARLTSVEERTFRRARSQRARWLAGRYSVLWAYAGRLLTANVSLWQKLDALAELANPGPVVRASCLLAVALVAVWIWPASAAVWFLAVVAAALAFDTLATMVAIVRQPRPLQSAIAFLFLLVYVPWRLASAAATLFRPPVSWQRTLRD